MMKRATPLLLVLCLGLALTASGLDYRFSVPEAAVTVTIEEDGAALIHYQLQFECKRGAHPIDVVDIGMPYLENHAPIEASVNGKPLPGSSIRVSTYLKPKGSGYEVHLGSRTIRPGKSGVFEFIARQEGMVWQDTTDPDQASFRFSPTWFGSQYCFGQTHLLLQYRLPIPAGEWVAVEEAVRWHKSTKEFSAKGVLENDDVASVAWDTNVQLTGKNEFGVSFPKRFVSQVREDSVLEVLMRWVKLNPESQLVSGGVVILLLGFVFFGATRGTGKIFFFVLMVAAIVGMVFSPVVHLACYPVLIVLGGIVLLWRTLGKQRYFPARLCREGGEIRRGFTPVEAAVLLEEPLQKVLTMVVFELARKGVITIRSHEPLHVEVVGKKRHDRSWELPDGTPVKLWAYEPRFILEFARQRHVPVHRMALEKPFDYLIKRVSRAMRRHDLKATRKYYKGLAASGWLQVEVEADHETRFHQVDKKLGWLMLDDGWDRQLHSVGHGYRYFPHWWYCHGGHHEAPIAAGRVMVPEAAVPQGVPDTSFSDVVTSVTGRLHTACERMMGKMDSVETTSRGGVDLSAVDRATGEFFDSIAASGTGDGGGGFGGGGGGCACAGCACACACAGGGR